MPTRRVDPTAPDPAVIAHAARILRDGGLVAFPTETVYGLGANALDARAVRRIFDAKGRPGYNPLIAHVHSAGAARALVTHWPPEAERLAAAFWPGPLTLVLPKQPVVPDVVTAGLPAVAVRVPAHPVALALLAAANVPVAAPSANRFTELSPTTAAHVEKALGDRVDLVLDGGPTSVGIESTVVDLTGARPTLLRPGTLSDDALAAVLGAAPARGAIPDRADAPRPAPGMIERHYAPRARVLLFDESERAGIEAWARDERLRAGALVTRPTFADLHVVERVLPSDPDGYARALYAELHALDDLGVDVVLVERPPSTPAWIGVLDRLERASR